MWVLAKHSQDNDEWEDLEAFDDLTGATTSLTARDDQSNLYVFWKGHYPEDKDERHEVIEQMIKVNNGRILSVFPGMQVKVEPISTLCGCSGRCFCVNDEDGCHCGCSYCRPNGCIWIRCNNTSC